ncbi:MAG: SurA N-terminal domain-containing protein [Candidatus Sumerlaeia bacterium]|nr:SurA N-terminal domain-containing protein [Candidatus Sumerlaeia bacterium]
MMQAMRNPKVLKWGLYALMVVAIPSFVLLGPNMGGGGGPAPEAIDFVEIKTSRGTEFLRNDDLRLAMDRAVQDNAMKFAYVTGNPQNQQAVFQFLPRFYDRNRKELAEYAVGSEAFKEIARRDGLLVSNEQLQKTVSEQFPTQEAYEETLARSGYTERGFLETVRENLKQDLGQRQVVKVARASVLESWLAYKNTNDRLEARYVAIPTDALRESVEVTDEELQAYFAENQENFIEPEKRVYRFVVQKAPALPPPAIVSEAEMLAYYNAADKANNPLFQVSPGRLVRHIALAIDDSNSTEVVTQQLNEIRSLLVGGANFEETANQFTQDPANLSFGNTVERLGGAVPGVVNAENEAGFVERYGRAWVDAVNGAEQGQITPVVVSDRYAFLIQFTGMSDGVLPFEEAKKVIEPLLKADKEKEREALLQARLDEIESQESLFKRLAAESTTLESLAQKINSSVQETSPTLTTRLFFRDIGSLQEHQEYMADLEVGIPTQVLRAAGTDNSVVMEIKEVIPSRPQTLEEVRLIVETNVRSQKAAQEAERIANLFAEKARGAAEGLDSAAEALPEYKDTYIVADTVEPFGRLNPPAEFMDYQTLGAVTFRSKVGDILVLRGGSDDAVTGYLVLELTSIDEPSKEEFLTDFSNYEQQLTAAKQFTFIQEFRQDAPDLLRPIYDRSLTEDPEEEARGRGRLRRQ